MDILTVECDWLTSFWQLETFYFFWSKFVLQNSSISDSNCQGYVVVFMQMQQMVNSDSRFTSSQQPIEAALGPRSQSGMSQQNQLSAIHQSQLGPSGNSVAHNSPSPPGSKSATPSPSSSAHEDENDDGLRVHAHLMFLWVISHKAVAAFVLCGVFCVYVSIQW